MIEVEKIWLTTSEVWIQTTDGRTACERFDDYPRLRNAKADERLNYTADEFGLHWERLDEDLSFEGFFNRKDRNVLYQFFSGHPELNASAIAKRMGMSQSLLAQYICGAKKPSAKRLDRIFSTIEDLGRELIAVRSFT